MGTVAAMGARAVSMGRRYGFGSHGRSIVAGEGAAPDEVREEARNDVTMEARHSKVHGRRRSRRRAGRSSSHSSSKEECVAGEQCFVTCKEHF